MNKTGKVYLVGAGPGDPGLITYRGMKLLQTCDVVIYDRLACENLLENVKKDCEKIYVGKAAGYHSMKQEDINRILVDKALTFQSVVRLKGGDPYVFGRGGEEALVLQEHGIDYEVIPGVTSAVAAAAYAGIPVTHRGASQSFHVITGHTADEESNIPEDFKTLAKLSGTLVILMGLGNLAKIREELLSGGKSPDTPAVVISSGTTADQKEVRGTLQNICDKVKEADISSPAVIIIGAVAALNLRPTNKAALRGIRIGITGTRKMTERLTEQLQDSGALVETVSTLEVTEYQNNLVFDTALKSLEQYQWVVFTSSNAVSIFFNRMKELRIDYRQLAKLRFAVIGSGTKQALQQQGFQADFMPKEYHSKALATGLCEVIRKKERILIPRAEQGSEELVEILSTDNKEFDDVKIYDIKEINRYSKKKKELDDTLDYLTFASASGVHAFFNNLMKHTGDRLTKTKIVCIGEATQQALNEYGYDNVLIAAESTVNGLAERIYEDVLSCAGGTHDTFEDWRRI